MAGWVRGLRSGDGWLASSRFLLRNLLMLMALYVLVRFLLHLAGLFSTGDGWSSMDTFYPAKKLPPILPSLSPVIADIQSGLVHVLDGHLKANDTALLLLYAPWCIHSARAAKTIVTVADRLREEVPVYAIDCWEPEGSCRWENPGIVFPQVVAVHRHVRGRLTYHGQLSVDALEQYGHHLLRPMVYVTSKTQLQELLVREEVVAVGRFDFSQPTTSPEFLQFYFASLLGLQTDSQTGSFLAPVFAVITSWELGVALNLQAPPSVTLLSLWGGRQTYPGRFRHDVLYRWTVATKPIMEVTRWLVPLGNLTYLLSQPLALLFLPNRHSDNATSGLIAEYRAAAIAHKREELGRKVCDDLAHLKHTSCLGEHEPHPKTFPLCSDHLDHTCPRHQPFFHAQSATNENSYCQDTVGNAPLTAGWPPPCDLVLLQFYLIDSDRYWSLANNMGFHGDPNEMNFPLIISDLRNRLQFIFSVDLTTNKSGFSDVFDSVLSGSAPLLYRSSSHDRTLSCQQWHPVVPCIKELSATAFGDAVLTSPLSVLVVHYTRWCAACVSVWPKIHSLAYLYRSVPDLLLTKMDGDSNDLPWCHSPTIFPSISLYPAGRKRTPVWFPLEWEISSHLLTQFIANHTAISPQGVGPEFGEDGHLPENGGEREWETKGWRLWKIAEKERRAVQRENQELVRRVNELEQRIKEAGSSLDTSNVMESLLVQLEEAVLKMMHNNQQSSGGTHGESFHRVMEKEVVDATDRDSVALAGECPTNKEECSGNGCPEQHQLDRNTANNPIPTD